MIKLILFFFLTNWVALSWYNFLVLKFKKAKLQLQCSKCITFWTSLVAGVFFLNLFDALLAASAAAFMAYLLNTIEEWND